MALQMSMVLFRESPTLSAGAIQAALAEHWPDLPAPTETKEGDGTISFGLGDVDVVLGVMPAPVPWSDRKSTRLNSSHEWISRMPSSA